MALNGQQTAVVTAKKDMVDFVERFGCDRWPLHYACRVGNLEHAQYLVDHLRCPVNERDAHDSTPLYFAALTGNMEICRFLLERGANCDESHNGGHDAARVFYVALTPELRRLLREWSLTAATRDPFLDSLRKTFNNPTYADVIVRLPSSSSSSSSSSNNENNDENNNNKENALPLQNVVAAKQPKFVYLHGIMIRTRCPRLAELMTPFHVISQHSDAGTCKQDDGDDDDEHQSIKYQIEFDDRYDCNVAMHVLNYLYTGTFDLGNNGKSFDQNETIEFVLQARQLAWELQLYRLVEDIDSSFIMSQANLENMHNHETATKDDCRPKTKKPKYNDRNEIGGQRRAREFIDHSELLRQDMKQLARWISTPYAEFSSLSELNVILDNTDVALQCMDSTWSVNMFRLCEESEYFQRGCLGGFREAKESTFDVGPLLPLPEAWKFVIQWMYCDEFLPEVDSSDHGQFFHPKTREDTKHRDDDDEKMDIESPTGGGGGVILSVETAVEILVLGFAILCPRLSSYVANTILVPAVDTENVFDLISIARMYNDTDATNRNALSNNKKLERLEEKCVTVIGSQFEQVKDDPALQSLLAEDAAGIVQGGDIQVTDVPICAEICRAIAKHYAHNAELRSDYIHYLLHLVENIVSNQKNG